MKATVRVLVALSFALVTSLAIAASGSGALSFTRPATYVDGSPLPPTAITGYEVKCSSFKPTGGVAGLCTFVPLTIPGSALAGTMTITIPVSGGDACFTLETLTALARSVPTNPVCKNFSPIAPDPAGNVVVAQVLTVNFAVAYTVTSTGSRGTTVIGFVPVGKPCLGDPVFTYRSQSYRRIARADLLWWKTTPHDNAAAPCAAG